MSDVTLYDRDPKYIPRVAAVHDMCGYGKCSLTAAIPILSAAGCDVCPVPTALFSAHTRYAVFPFHDTTDILSGYLDAWQKEDVELDGVYSGFLGSPDQVAIIQRLYREYPNALRLVDPVMGDAGEMYPTYTPELCEAMGALADGADVVVYSTTKYIGGHSDVVGGAVVVNDEETREKVAFLQNAAGAVPSPFDSWLDIRGLKTLAVRVQRHSENALKIAQWLETRPEVERVWYPGLESHPGHEIAARQMHGGFGGMISVQLAAGFEAAKRFAGATQIFTLAESLGGVESLIEHPGAMTHASVAGTTLEVPANLVRLSVGIEGADDLIADLEQAFAAI